MDVSGTTCNMTFWNSAWTTPSLTVTDVDWQRDQLLIMQLGSSSSGTSFRVLGSRTGDKQISGSQILNWTATTRLDVGPTYNGRISPPIWFSADTSNTGTYGAPALLDLDVVTTNNSATITFAANDHCTGFVDWGTASPTTAVSAGQGTRFTASITGLTSATNYVYRIRLTSVWPGDALTTTNMAFRTK
jgi:hypothetical protein